MRILVITPKLPYPANGADEQDRLSGIRLLQDGGHTVMVIAKKHEYQNQSCVSKMEKDLGLRVIPVPYRERHISLQRLLNPLWIDGAAYEYTDPLLRKEVDIALRKFQPEVVWVDGSYAWPIAHYVRKKDFYVVIRSLNRESVHLLSDEGYSILNLIRFIAKEVGEYMAARSADVVGAITPKENKFYSRIGKTPVYTLPLRRLPYILQEHVHVPVKRKQLHIMFNGATYSVCHNRKVAEYLIQHVAPKVNRELPGKVLFHITGAKLPPKISTNLPKNVVYEGYVQNFEEFVSNMDIALAPSLGGEGMQQKIFDPIVRGIPTITTSRGTVGYKLVHKENVYLAENVQEIVLAIKTLLSIEERTRVSKNTRDFANQHFSHKRFLDTIQNILSFKV